MQELYGGPYLAGLKELSLKLSNYDNVYHPLAPALDQATALELLDLSGHRHLLLRKQDTDLLAKLPSLKTVCLPVPGPGEVGFAFGKVWKRNVAVVKNMQKVLGQAGVKVKVVPLWQGRECHFLRIAFGNG